MHAEPKVLSAELARLKEKLLNPKHQAVPEPQGLISGSDLIRSADSGEIQKSMEALNASLPVHEQTKTGSAPGDSSGARRSKDSSAKPYIEQFAAPTIEAPESTDKATYRPDLSLGEPGRFPISAFPASIREIAEQLASVYQAPICVPAMCMLAALSAAVGKSAVVARGLRDLVTTLYLFVVIVAERGTCKSVIGRKATEPIERYSEKLVLEHREKVAAKKTELAMSKKLASKLESEAARITTSGPNDLLDKLTEKHQRIAELEDDADRRVTAIESDITGEALVRSLEDNNETIFSYSPEAGGVVSVAVGKYKDGTADIDPYLSGYTGEPIRATRVGRGSVVVQQPCLTLLWLMQGIVALDLMDNRAMISRGFTARTLFFDSGSRREFDNRKDESFTMAAAWERILNLQLCRRQLGHTAREIVCSSEAREVFAKFQDEGINLERHYCPDLSGEFSRQRENAIKIGGLFALAENQDEVTEELATRAVTVVRWVGYNYLTLIQIQRKERLKKDFDRVAEVLQEAGGTIGLGALAQYHGIKREKIEALIAVYPGDFVIRKVPQPPGKPGRAAEFLTTPSAPIPSEPSGDKIEKIEKLTGGTAAA